VLKKIFYSIKSLIPRKAQISLRRVLVQKQVRKYRDIWPIYPGSETRPNYWRGWPSDKKFAFVLTHDVEHKRGYDRVLHLMKIEKELGFVSSFNFVPERDYIVESELLSKLKMNGFEVGVHGLHHDGKLFQNKKLFFERAKKINQYLVEWNAVGFRAPSMHHNLELIGNLNLEYDLSTFDTDPFEPQSDGVKTIYPFWVNVGKQNGGYVELPYTMVQDFTLFVLMKEKTINVWKKKLDWIAEKGGMALLNIHPDYLNFENQYSLEEFPVNHYLELLEYVESRYERKYWQALPKEVAHFVKLSYWGKSV
jgi:peptidoglycan/xylan/chitin deacetylase (PgdA/CDA1 family)